MKSSSNSIPAYEYCSTILKTHDHFIRWTDLI